MKVSYRNIHDSNLYQHRVKTPQLDVFIIAIAAMVLVIEAAAAAEEDEDQVPVGGEASARGW